MTQIKIEVPANDHIALSAMADALQRIAAERQHVDLTPKGVTPEHAPEELTETFTRTVSVGDESITETTVKQYQSTETHDEELEASVQSENTKYDEELEASTQQDDTLDADDLPWDKRIHSRGKTRLSDDTWRLARKPNDKTDDEWSAYVESVKSELKAVQDIPSETSVTTTVQLNEGVTTDDIVEVLTSEPTLDEQAVADLTPPVTDEDNAASIEDITQAEVDAGNLTPPVVDEPTAPTLTPPAIDTEAPVAPVTPPTSLTPPVESPSDQPSVTTFEELMIYITGDAKKRGADTDMIKATLVEVDPALIAIPLIGTRADLIPKFVTALEAKLV